MDAKKIMFGILLAFLLITITLLIAVSIYSYLINIKQSKSIYYERFCINQYILKINNKGKNKDIKNHTY